MSVSKLRDFYEQTLNQAKADGMMVSLHVKATMMKVLGWRGEGAVQERHSHRGIHTCGWSAGAQRGRANTSPPPAGI
eukprot:scaffold6863_cov112-Isochrysis_galbana.AAC.3